ncbi:Intracellular protein transporter USO1-like protein [Quillaja saponaria]|uniref:Intracellular protein transporter USO1-like protein n=1 Tax=Quillaja saponaria TaxID=32244 RepID=A0AAD7L5R9_QUISA|nr:Intracellular protein transporter USO1-like protein [Quillaja saponaria]
MSERRNEKGEKSEEGEAEKGENLGEKLRRVVLVGKKGGPCTPVPSWRLWAAQDTIIKDHLLPPHTVSARKLAAALWEFQHYIPLFNMHRTVNNGAAGDSRPRRHHYHHNKDKGLDLSTFLAVPSPSSPDQPASASSLRRHLAASLMQHHRSIERNKHALQPVSPASYGSSMEMAPYNPAATPTSSLDFKGRIGESHYNLKTSTELLKVLNRIWSLEEQHASNISMIKALKMELHHASVKIKELLQDRQADRHEIDDLIKQIAEDKLVMKSKEQDRLHAAVQSMKDELEDERKLRKRSESLHRKLARELSEVKSSFSNALKELERERKTKKLLEDLCDEFSRGIKEYEQEAHALRQKPDNDWAESADQDRFILHISESWLDERMQMQLEEAENGLADKSSIAEKLRFEIETFLKAKHSNRTAANLMARDRRHSLESVPLNDAVSAPQAVGDEEDSLGSDSNCFELKKPSNRGSKLKEDDVVGGVIEEPLKSNHNKKKSITRERIKSRSPSSLQVKFEEQMAWAMSSNADKKSQAVDTEPGKTIERKPVEMRMSENSEHCEVPEVGGHERRNKHDELHGSNKNHMIDSLIRSQLLVSENSNIHPENDYGEASCSNSGWRNQASPVRQWMARLPPQDLDISQPPKGLRENTLKAKLLEARSKGQRSRMKALKGSF